MDQTLDEVRLLSEQWAYCRVVQEVAGDLQPACTNAKVASLGRPCPRPSMRRDKDNWIAWWLLRAVLVQPKTRWWLISNLDYRTDIKLSCCLRLKSLAKMMTPPRGRNPTLLHRHSKRLWGNLSWKSNRVSSNNQKKTISVRAWSLDNPYEWTILWCLSLPRKKRSQLKNQKRKLYQTTIQRWTLWCKTRSEKEANHRKLLIRNSQKRRSPLQVIMIK